MSYSKTTYNDLKLSLAYRYGETAVPSSGDSNRNFWLNKAVQYMADKLGLKKSTSITVSSGEGTLPDDFKIPLLVIDSNDVVYKHINPQDNIIYDSNDVVYWITGNHKDGYTLNTNSDDTFTVWYQFFPDDMSSASDICIIPDGEAVVAYAYGMLRKSETDPLGDATSALSEAESRLAKMLYNEKARGQSLRMKLLENVVNNEDDF